MRFYPSNGYVGDAIPFYHEGSYHLFYLRRPPDGTTGVGTPWAHAVSTDLIHWEELSDAFRTGEGDAPDCGDCWTGSVIEREGVFHAFYTGHAPRHPTRPQTVCRATSSDLIHWEKDARNPILLPDPRWYEASDWRDPFLFWNEEEGRYWMVVTSRTREPAGAPRRGCLALATSPDLEAWEVHPPIWTPYSVHAPECPDLWRDGERWRVLYSNGTTQAREAEGLSGPWLRGKTTDTDGRWFYAAKCYHDGERHLLVGWIPSRQGGKDSGTKEWGGDISLPREAVPLPDGELGWRVPDEVDAAWKEPLAIPEAETLTGAWQNAGDSLTGGSPDGLALAVLRNVPASYRLQVELDLSRGAAAPSAGFLLRFGTEGESGYAVVLDSERQEVLIRPWQRWGDTEAWAVQPLSIRPGEPVTVDLFLDGGLLEIFLNGTTVLSARCCDHQEGGLGLWAQDGGASFQNLKLYSRPG